MNDQSADKLRSQVLGKTVGGWQIKAYLNHGKSAAVFLAERSGQTAAIKIFDSDIIDRYGRNAQLTRINRERGLIGKSHPNLVQIFDGGEDGKLMFVAMEYFPGGNLAEGLKEVRICDVRSIISQIASAAKFLEDASFAHRDIKPSNIGLSLDKKFVKLLDFGVLRPFDLTDVTDEGDQHFFVGTLQYSPPELLFREEEHTLEAWRAITFYQIGAVLYDLLTQKPIFSEFVTPYARLVRAVEKEVPRLDSDSTEADLRLLAQNCLAKDPIQRLNTVKWEDFSRPEIADPMEAARRKIALHRGVQTTVSEPELAQEHPTAQWFSLRSSIHSAFVNTIKVEGLPRYSLKEIQKPHPYILRVSFWPSAKVGLEQYLACYCQGTVIDPGANLLELKFWACVATNRDQIPFEPDSKAPFSCIRGALIDQDIRIQVQRRLLFAYADGLDSHLSTKNVSWLEMVAEI